jgi:hypothetical protein
MNILEKINRIKFSVPKKYLIIILSIVLIAALFIGLAIKQKSRISVVESQTYHEIETDFNVDEDYGRPTEEAMAGEITSLKAKGNKFWYDQSQKMEMKESMQDVYGRIKCKEGKCFMVGMSIKDSLDYLRPSLPGWKIGDCQAVGYDDWCEIIEPKFSENMMKISGQDWLLNDFYIFGKDVYAVGSVKGDDNKGDDNKGDENYSVFENGKEIFSHRMSWGAESPIEEASVVLGSPAFTFYNPIDWKNETDIAAISNVWYKDETMNEKYAIESSSFLFSYKDKIGFVGGKNGKSFFFFNGQKVSQDFDEIRTHSCCSIWAYPIELDQNGILFFYGKRGGKYFFTEVDLNKYL